jgi:transposase
MNASKKRYLRFCGIDVGKDKHVAAVVHAEGHFLVNTQSFPHSRTGFQLLFDRLKGLGRPADTLVGLEATGPYWYSLHEFLAGHGYAVIVLNPIQTAREGKKAIRKCKTDKRDARSIAVLLKNGTRPPTLIPDDQAMTCRQLTRTRYALVQKMTRAKLQLWARLHPVWPEYEPLFADPFGATGRTLLARYPVPADIRQADPVELANLIRSASRGKYGPDRLEKIRKAAEVSIGITQGLDGFRTAIRSGLDELVALRNLRDALDEQILPYAEDIPNCLLTLPGISPLQAVSLYGELHPIANFKRPEMIVAFAGFDTTVFQTGNYDAPHRSISKRGSPYLRRTIWFMAARAVQSEGDLRTFYLRKRNQGLHHLAAVTATALRLCHVIWRILTDQRDYRPEGRPNKSS